MTLSFFAAQPLEIGYLLHISFIKSKSESNVDFLNPPRPDHILNRCLEASYFWLDRYLCNFIKLSLSSNLNKSRSFVTLEQINDVL